MRKLSYQYLPAVAFKVLPHIAGIQPVGFFQKVKPSLKVSIAAYRLTEPEYRL